MSQDFATSFKDRERSEMVNPLTHDIKGITPEELFRKKVNQYIDTELTNLENNKYEIRELVDKLPKIEYKNPGAFIIAYNFIYLEKDDKKLKKSVENYLTGNIVIEDIIRYVRLIRSIQK
jgi:hypothetical protein